MISEAEVERTLRVKLTDYGFLVLKLYTPGHTGVMDRMILRPRYSPGPPMFLEIKRSKKKLRPLQAAIGEDWKRRGCMVLEPIAGVPECEQRCAEIIALILPDYAFAKASDI